MSLSAGDGCAHESWLANGTDSVSIRCPQCGDEIGVSPAFAAHRAAIDREVERLATRDEAKREYEAIFREPPPELTLVGSETDMGEEGGALEWLIEPILNVGAFVLLTAQAKTGKTTFILTALAALHAGEPFLGWPTHPDYQRRSAYLNLDMTPNLYRYYAEPIGVTDDVLVLHGASGQYDVMDESFTGELAAKLLAANVGILVVDVWSSIYTGDESDNSEAGRGVGALQRLRQAANLDALVLLHHAGWPGKEVKKNRSRGASSVEGKVDVLWRLDPAGPNRSTFYVDRSRIPYSKRTEVVYNEASRTISVGGVNVPGSSESDAAEERRIEKKARRQRITKAVRLSPRISQTAIQDAVGGNAGANRTELTELVAEGVLLVEEGDRNAKLYTLK